MFGAPETKSAGGTVFVIFSAISVMVNTLRFANRTYQVRVAELA
jgi:hypothetical protein